MKWIKSFLIKNLFERNGYDFVFAKSDDFDTFMEATRGLQFGKYFGNYDDALKMALRQLSDGYNVMGDGTIKTILRHEYGHHMQAAIKDTLQNAENRLEFSNEFLKAISNKSGMSEYSKFNESEMFAEAFAEWSSGGTSEFAKAFGGFIKRYL